MELQEYITKDEVRRVCKALKIRDWTRLKEGKVLSSEAKKILSKVNVEKMDIDLEEFRIGLEVELEHGIRFRDANVTNNHPVVTGMIVLAHLKESLNYYKLLEVAELQGDLIKAIEKGSTVKIKHYYKRLANAWIALHRAEIKALR